MAQTVQEFVVTELYSNEEIYTSLGVGNTGGIRCKKEPDGTLSRIVIFTSIPTPRQLAENPYQDRLEGDILTYTGTGKAGKQMLSGFNSRIPEQTEKKIPIYAFVQIANRRNKKIGVKRWGFLGLVEYIRCFQENQIDHAGGLRSVWLFEFRLCSACTRIRIDTDSLVMRELLACHADNDTADREVFAPSFVTDVPKAIETARAEEIRSRLLNQTPETFEHTLAEILYHSGFEEVNVTRFSQDGGIDINARLGWKAWPLRHLLTQIQAKRWRHTVGRKEVAELRGSLQPHAAGCIVTTSRFSRAAMAEATEQGKIPITTINGEELAKIICDISPSIFCSDACTKKPAAASSNPALPSHNLSCILSP